MILNHWYGQSGYQWTWHTVEKLDFQGFDEPWWGFLRAIIHGAISLGKKPSSTLQLQLFWIAMLPYITTKRDSLVQVRCTASKITRKWPSRTCQGQGLEVPTSINSKMLWFFPSCPGHGKNVMDMFGFQGDKRLFSGHIKSKIGNSTSPPAATAATGCSQESIKCWLV